MLSMEHMHVACLAKNAKKKHRSAAYLQLNVESKQIMQRLHMHHLYSEYTYVLHTWKNFINIITHSQDFYKSGCSMNHSSWYYTLVRPLHDKSKEWIWLFVQDSLKHQWYKYWSHGTISCYIYLYYIFIISIYLSQIKNLIS